MSDEGFTQAKSGDVVTLEEGAHIEGEFMSVEESKMFADSYALKLKVGGENKVLFVNNIVTDLIKSEKIVEGDIVRVFFKGLKKNEAGTRKYKDYEVWFKKKGR